MRLRDKSNFKRIACRAESDPPFPVRGNDTRQLLNWNQLDMENRNETFPLVNYNSAWNTTQKTSQGHKNSKHTELIAVYMDTMIICPASIIWFVGSTKLLTDSSGIATDPSLRGLATPVCSLDWRFYPVSSFFYSSQKYSIRLRSRLREGGDVPGTLTSLKCLGKIAAVCGFTLSSINTKFLQMNPGKGTMCICKPTSSAAW